MLAILTIVPMMFHSEGKAQEKFSLTYKLEKGKTYRYAQDNIIETTQEMGGQEMKMNTDGHSVMQYVIEDVTKEGVMTVVYSYAEAKFRMKGMGRDTTMDIKDLTTASTRAEILPTGKVIKNKTADTSKSAKSSMAMNMFANANLAILPDKSVAVGDKWSRVSSDTTESDGGQMIYKRNLEYIVMAREKKGNHECLKIDFKGTMEITGKMKQMGMDMVLEGSGDVSGTVWFDPAAGLLIEDQNINTIEMTMALTGQAQMTIPMTQKVNSTQKLIE